METIILNNILNEANDIPTHLCESITSGNSYSINEDTFSINKESAIHKEYYISNTLSIKNAFPTQMKNIMFYLKDKHDITIDGNHSTFLADGEQIYILLDNCKNITFKNFVFDYVRPTVTEFEVLNVTGKTVDIRFDSNSTYEITHDGKLVLTSLDGNYADCGPFGLTQEYNAENDTTTRISTPTAWKVDVFKKIINATSLDNDTVRLTYSKLPYNFKVGCVYEFRDVRRTQSGFFITESENITFDNIETNFMHGLGLVCQCSKNITVDNCSFVPSGDRKTCGFADLIHCVGCSGDINITNSRFNGAHDDALNVHGVHQRITKYISNNEFEVSFMHTDAFGYKYYDKGDELEFIDSKSLTPFFKAKIVDTRFISKTTSWIKIDAVLPKHIKFFHRNCVVENITKNSSNVLFENNVLSNIPTRGILLTTSGKIEVRENHFIKTQMSAILIADDAKNWYESGRVKDVTISNNFFEQCKEPVINIHPENTKFTDAVHCNITIKDNKFDLINGLVLEAKATDNITLVNNTDVDSFKIDDSYCKFKNCSNVFFEN